MDELEMTRLIAAAQITSSRVLVTRHAGRRFLETLDNSMYSLSQETVIVLDFSDIEIIDASFIDEVFSTWATRHAHHGATQRYLLLRSLSDALLENFAITMESRPLREKGVRNCVLPYIARNGIGVDRHRVELVGKVEPHLRETFDLLREWHVLHSGDVAQVFQLDPHAASVRLKALFDVRLALRNEETVHAARQFVYHWPF